MLAVDTNIVVRLLTGDDAKQTAIARSLFASRQIWIAKTVLLEISWVLESLYGFKDSEISEALKRVLGLENVAAEDAASVAAALALTEGGIEFADALHLCSRPKDAQFASFDRACVKRAERAGLPGVLPSH